MVEGDSGGGGRACGLFLPIPPEKPRACDLTAREDLELFIYLLCQPGLIGHI